MELCNEGTNKQGENVSSNDEDGLQSAASTVAATAQAVKGTVVSVLAVGQLCCPQCQCFDTPLDPSQIFQYHLNIVAKTGVDGDTAHHCVDAVRPPSLRCVCPPGQCKCILLANKSTAVVCFVFYFLPNYIFFAYRSLEMYV